MAAFIKKLAKNDINIKFAEGSLNIKIDESLNIFMRGPVSEIKHTKLEIWMGLFDKFKIGLGKSSDGLSAGFENIFSKKKLIKTFSQNSKN